MFLNMSTVKTENTITKYFVDAYLTSPYCNRWRHISTHEQLEMWATDSPPLVYGQSQLYCKHSTLWIIWNETWFFLSSTKNIVYKYLLCLYKNPGFYFKQQIIFKVCLHLITYRHIFESIGLQNKNYLFNNRNREVKN